MVYSNFIVETKEIQSPFGSSKVYYLIFKRDFNENIIKSIGEILDTDDEIYNDPVRIEADKLYPYIDRIQSKIEHSEDFTLVELSSWLNDHYKSQRDQLERMKTDGKINFNNLESIINIGTKCIGMVMDQPIGFIANNVERGVNPYGQRYFSITGRVTISDGDKFKQFDKRFVIEDFRGAIEPSNLPVRPINEEEMRYLTERGKKFVKYGKSCSYVGYSGNMFRQTPYGIYKFEAHGRCIVDPIGFSKKNPSYPKNYNTVDCQDIPEDLMFMCYPFVNGFSFTAKQWGEMYVENIDDIQFDDKAYDYLVMDESLKQMIKALIVNSEGTFSDIIQKKSGGTIICLCGPPGVGKTLMSESISELLHKPLYSIGCGELGSNVEKLEHKLAEILEIANAWNAIILLDEADIFMEKRSINDIQRNAMVSVFLRLLERYQGIMFLTTNRPEHFDEAFKSRITININFTELDKQSRYQVWKNLLDVAGNMSGSGYGSEQSVQSEQITPSDIKHLSEHKMNGRQIKNCIRMGQCIAKNENKILSRELIERVIPFVI